jgi:hypothetical protein
LRASSELDKAFESYFFLYNIEYYFTRSTLRLYYEVQTVAAVSGNNLCLF